MKDTQYQSQLQMVKNKHEKIRQLIAMQLEGATLKLVHDLFQEEVKRLCGKPFSHKKSEGLCHRGGSGKGSVILQGQRIRVQRPRLRKNKEEVPLESYTVLQSFDLLCEDVMRAMLLGVSTRNYEPLQRKLEDGLGLKKSSVSKAFKMSCQKSLEAIQSRNLSQESFVAFND